MLESLKFRPDKVTGKKPFLGLKNQKFLAFSETRELSIELGANRRILRSEERRVGKECRTLRLSYDIRIFQFRVKEKNRAKTRSENHPSKNRKTYFILKPEGNKG